MGNMLQRFPGKEAALFNQYWRYSQIWKGFFKELIERVPPNVKIIWGLTKKQKEIRDWYLHCPVKSSVLRAIYAEIIKDSSQGSNKPTGTDPYTWLPGLQGPPPKFVWIVQNEVATYQLPRIDNAGGGEDSDEEDGFNGMMLGGKLNAVKLV